MSRERYRRRTDWLTYLGLGIVSLFMLLPFIWLLCASLKTQAVFFEGQFLPPGDGFLGINWGGLTFDHYARLLSGEDLPFARYVLNSVFYASANAILATFFCAMGGYALSKYRFKGNGTITALVLAALVIPGSLLLAPSYQLIYELGLLNSFAGLLLPGLAPAFGLFLFRQATMNAVPHDLLEAARIDGMGEFRIFFLIVVPLIRPMMGAFLLISFMFAWNNFVMPQIILQDPDKLPLAVGIVQLKGLYSTDFGLIMAGTMVSIIPVMALFLLLQKDFIAGLTSGAVKG
ncbi:MAG: carbohydrate ABC transporter permease [Opitutales bacterium]